MRQVVSTIYVSVYLSFSIGRNFLGVQLKKKSNLCTAVTIQNIQENNKINSHAQNTNVFQLDIF
jgi:hypothetical protein